MQVVIDLRNELPWMQLFSFCQVGFKKKKKLQQSYIKSHNLPAAIPFWNTAWMKQIHSNNLHIFAKAH